MFFSHTKVFLIYGNDPSLSFFYFAFSSKLLLFERNASQQGIVIIDKVIEFLAKCNFREN